MGVVAIDPFQMFDEAVGLIEVGSGIVKHHVDLGSEVSLGLVSRKGNFIVKVKPSVIQASFHFLWKLCHLVVAAFDAAIAFEDLGPDFGVARRLQLHDALMVGLVGGMVGHSGFI